jgi:4'-phosphopantetheinyl transferase
MPSEDILVWWIDTDIEVGSEFLSPDERDRASRFVFDHDRRRWIAARALLRYTLGEYLGMQPSKIVFNYGENGKPRLAASDVQFNLSHSGNAAVCAITRHEEVGIDVEWIWPRDDIDRLFETIASPAEWKIFKALAPSQRTSAFFETWTTKEACLKASGAGLTIDPRGIETLEDSGVRSIVRVNTRHYRVTRFTLGHSYVGSLAVAGDESILFPARTGIKLKRSPIERLGIGSSFMHQFQFCGAQSGR